MKIEKLRIKNYKGFRDSGDIIFGPTFNVIVGQNNSGKSALLEAFRLNTCPNRPYRGLGTDPLAFDPNSTFEVRVTISGKILRDSYVRNPQIWQIPIPQGRSAKEFVSEVFTLPSLTLNFTTSSSGSTAPYPSHNLFRHIGDQAPRSVQIRLNPDRSTVGVVNIIANQDDHFLNIVDGALSTNIYVFRAERMNVGSCPIDNSDIMQPNASNLPSVLMLLQANHHKFERFNEHVRAIIPNIYRVAVRQNEQLQATIKLWTVNPESEREDLTVLLSEAGTGVSQVLAILYVAMTRTENILVIDEPNSFLHPGAARKLIQILKQYGSNQYVFSTHSPELISVSDPDTIHLVQWNGEESVVTPFNKSSIASLQRILNDIGVTLADVFGADKIVWVEGPTERACFPLLADLLPVKPIGVSFVSLRNTGDLESTKSDARAIIEIYDNLSAGASLVPPTLSFNLDKEDRSDQLIQDIRRQTRDRVKFLPRLTYENYLLDADAIAAVFNDEATAAIVEARATPQNVADWLNTHGGDYANGAVWTGDSTDATWVEKCRAPNLLKALFDSLHGARLAFKKTTHSVALTKWLIDNKRNSLDELVTYVGSLLQGQEV